MPQAFAEPTLAFEKEVYCPPEQVIVTMNDAGFDPNVIDIFTLEFFLNSDPVFIGLFLIETGPNTRTFVGDFVITDGTTPGSVIVSDGDIMTIELDLLSLSATAIVDCSPQTPAQAIQVLIDEVISMNLPKGTETSLISNLDSAIEKLADDNPENDSAACGELGSFINKVDAQDGKKLTAEQAATLRTLATDIRSSLDCI